MIQSIYFFLNKNLSDALNNKYIYIDNQTLVLLLIGTKKAYSLKTESISHTYPKYKKKIYLKAKKASI